MSTEIHPTAVIDASAELAADVSVGPFSVIGPNVQIGRGTRVGSHVVIEGHTSIGERCEIFQFASVGARPQDLKYRGEPSTLIIGNGNVIREYVTLQPGTEGGKMTTTIGEGNLFMACSHVGHDCVVGDRNILANSVALAGHVTIHNNVILGGMVGVHQFVRIGNHAFLGGGSMVGQDIAPYCFGQGDRCHLRGVNLVGLQRAGMSSEEVTAIKKAYRHFFSVPGGVTGKLNTLPQELAELPVVEVMTKFIRESERGLAQPHRNVSQGDS